MINGLKNIAEKNEENTEKLVKENKELTEKIKLLESEKEAS